MSKTAGMPSLKNSIKEAASLKKQIDQLRQESGEVEYDDNQSIANKDRKIRSLYEKCLTLKKDADTLRSNVETLARANEPTKISNFEERKKEELNRLQLMMNEIAELEAKLDSDKTESEYLIKTKENLEKDEDDENYEDYDEEESNNTNDEEDDAEEEDDEIDSMNENDEDNEDDEDNDGEVSEEGDDMTPSPTDEDKVEYEVKHSFDKQEEGDLEVRLGEIVTLISIREDGWWECENSDGKRGYVPSTYLKEFVRSDSIEDDENSHRRSRSGKELWGEVKKDLRKTSAADVLSAFGAVPSGFREPTSAKAHSQDDTYTHVNFNAVKLSNSNLFYKDLFFNTATKKVRPATARIQKIVTLLEAKNIPLPGASSVVLSRLARVSLSDGSKILSNITVVKGEPSDREGRNWKFNVCQTSLETSECFVRIMEPNNKVGVLIELSVIFTKDASSKPKELSCGWVFRPMFEENGTLILNKQYDMPINGGIPFEHNVELDPSIARRNTSKIMTLISRNKQPTLSLKTAAANSELKERFDVLPHVLVGKTLYLHVVALHRHVLACALIRDRENLQSLEGIFDPFLSHLPSLLEQPDLLDILLNDWESKVKALNKSEKKDWDILASVLVKSFTEWVYPMMHMHFPPYRIGDPNKERDDKINKFIQKAAENGNSPRAALFSPEVELEPFDINEASYTLLTPHCITVV